MTTTKPPQPPTPLIVALTLGMLLGLSPTPANAQLGVLSALIDLFVATVEDTSRNPSPTDGSSPLPTRSGPFDNHSGTPDALRNLVNSTHDEVLEPLWDSIVDGLFVIYGGATPDEIRQQLQELEAACNSPLTEAIKEPDYTQDYGTSFIPAKIVALPLIPFMLPEAADLHSKYERVIALCKRAYETARARHANNIDNIARRARERQREIADAVTGTHQWLLAKRRGTLNAIARLLEAHLDRNISESEVFALIIDHPSIVDQEILSYADAQARAQAALECYETFLQDDNVKLLADNAVSLCQSEIH